MKPIRSRVPFQRMRFDSVDNMIVFVENSMRDRALSSKILDEMDDLLIALERIEENYDENKEIRLYGKAEELAENVATSARREIGGKQLERAFLTMANDLNSLF